MSIEERKKFQYTEYRNGGVLSSTAEDLSEQLRNDGRKSSEHADRETGNTTEHAQRTEKVRSEPETKSAEAALREELLQLAASNPLTESIRHIAFRRALPVDSEAQLIVRPQ